MKEIIGHTAGKIWETLSKNDEVSVSRLPKIIDEKQVIVYQSLGWLARENKIKYSSKGNKTTISLMQ